MVFGLMLSNDMYLLMVFLQFAAVCLVVIPWAFALAIFCNFAIVFIYVGMFPMFVGGCGMFVGSVYSVWMSMCWCHVVGGCGGMFRIAFRMLWKYA